MVCSLPYYSKSINLMLLDYRQGGIGDGSHLASSSGIEHTTLVACTWPWRAYLHHSKWQILQIRGLSSP